MGASAWPRAQMAKDQQTANKDAQTNVAANNIQVGNHAL